MGPKLDYPAGREPLKRGYLYRWEVTDQDSRPVTSGQFLVATESELKQLEELRQLAASGDRADLLAAALSYRRLGCYAEAIAAFERLAKLAPDLGVYREELAELYRQAGRPGDAEGGSRGAK
jgi:tetratricopeptide (TPR) repeat protein